MAILLFHELGQVEHLEHKRKGVLIRGRVPGRLLARFKPWEVIPGTRLEEDDVSVPE